MKKERMSSLAEDITYRLDCYAAELNGTEPRDLLAMVVNPCERATIEWVMAHVGNNKLRAAECLSVSRNTLERKLTSHGFQPQKSPAPTAGIKHEGNNDEYHD